MVVVLVRAFQAVLVADVVVKHATVAESFRAAAELRYTLWAEIAGEVTQEEQAW
jgi:hypothetical protein